MTRQTVQASGGSNVFDMEYIFSTGQNNGRISSSNEHVTNEVVNYTYDALQRLVSAQTQTT